MGGTNASMSYPNGEIFDYGMKVYYECGIEQIDSLVEQALPAEDFFVYSDNAKDRLAAILIIIYRKTRYA